MIPKVVCKSTTKGLLQTSMFKSANYHLTTRGGLWPVSECSGTCIDEQIFLDYSLLVVSFNFGVNVYI